MANHENEPQQTKTSTEQSVSGIFKTAAEIYPDDLQKQAGYIVTAHKPEGLGDFEPVNLLRDSTPFPFAEADLKIDRLQPGVEYTLNRFYRWRDENPAAVLDYIAECQKQLRIAGTEYGNIAKIGRSIRPFAERKFRRQQTIFELETFGVRNMAEIPDNESITDFSRLLLPREKYLKKILERNSDLKKIIRQMLSTTTDSQLVQEIETQLNNLHRILPEKVIKNGAMGKVLWTMLGVGTIAAYDLRNASPEQKNQQMIQVMHGAVVYGSVYAIIDDTLQDLQGNYISGKFKDEYYQTILTGLKTGRTIDINRLPDHPLSGQIAALFEMFIRYYPIEKYPHLFAAAESMYISQERDARLSMQDSGSLGLKKIYPDIFIKAAMSRVIANIIARKNLDPDFYNRCINTLFVNQLRDDLIDYGEDLDESRVTPFTLPYHQGENPLYDLFAYDAYIAATIQPEGKTILARSLAVYFSRYLSLHPDLSDKLLQKFGQDTPLILKQFMQSASGLPKSTASRLTPVDRKLRDSIGETLSHREQSDINTQTFILDRREKINHIIRQYLQNRKPVQTEDKLLEINEYAIGTEGKRIRPALTLMLAESLGTDPDKITPLIVAVEVFQASSLILDDLQDNSNTRRGKPAAHTVYSAASVELASLDLLLDGIRVIQDLHKNHPPANVIKITGYITQTIQDICRGQNMDLTLKPDEATVDNILQMYHLKTSLPIEASLVPLMILENRPENEIELIKRFAHHAGLVFQMKDDLLDTQSNPEDLGKETNQDINKVNLVRIYGPEKTRELMNYHLNQAIAACRTLPFNTNLLQGTVRYFAERRK
jgi:geranylgeranyl pyrophosphate synthase